MDATEEDNHGYRCHTSNNPPSFRLTGKYFSTKAGLSLAGQTFKEGRESLVDFLCARAISLTSSLTFYHKTNMR